MKGFSTFLTILALIALGYFAYPAAMDFFRDMGWMPKNKVVANVPAVPEVSPPSAPVTPPSVPTPVVPTPAPTVPTTATTPDVDAQVSRIPEPVIKSLEEITANWKNVPERAFPSTITINADAVFKLPQGNMMKLSAGKPAVPMALDASGMLTIAPRPGSALRAQLPVDQTDFKQRVTERYEAGVARIRQNIQKRRDAERERLANAAAVSEDIKASAGSVPKTSSDEALYIALMKSSVENGDLKDVTIDKVKSWRFIGYEDIQGVGYWTGAAVILKTTFFGDFETEAKALIRQGKVEKWLLPGVDE